MASLDYYDKKGRAMKAAEDRHQRVYSEPPPPSSVASDAAIHRFGDAEQQRVATALPDADAVGAIKTSPSPGTDVALAATRNPRSDAGNDRVPPFEGASPSKPPKMGTRNDPKVRSLQQSLKDLADFTKDSELDPKGVDSIFGKNTKAALSAFQRKYGLPVTGVADDATVRKLQTEQERVTAGKPSLRLGESETDPEALTDRTRYTGGIRVEEKGAPALKADPVKTFSNMNDLQLDALARAGVLTREQISEIKSGRPSSDPFMQMPTS